MRLKISFDFNPQRTHQLRAERPGGVAGNSAYKKLPDIEYLFQSKSDISLFIKYYLENSLGSLPARSFGKNHKLTRLGMNEL